jgi:hypothetical protein
MHSLRSPAPANAVAAISAAICSIAHAARPATAYNLHRTFIWSTTRQSHKGKSAVNVLAFVIAKSTSNPMPSNSGLIASFWEYLRAAGFYWWVALAVLLGIERIAERAAPTFWQRRVDPWFTSARRKQVLIAFALLAFVIGNFRAWDEERQAKEAAEQKLVSAAPSEAWWPVLTEAEKTALAGRVRSIEPEDIVVACETVNCKELADGIAVILQRTTGWKVEILHHGGMDITGVTGIQIDPNEPATQSLKEAIEATTMLKVTMGPDTRKDYGRSRSILVVGTKPF